MNFTEQTCHLGPTRPRRDGTIKTATFLVSIFFICAILRQSEIHAQIPITNTFFSDVLSQMDAAIQSTISSNKIPGGVLWLERRGTAYHKAYGSRALVPVQESMTEDTIFDAASLTKVLATTPAAMLLIERGRISLDAPVVNYVQEFTGDGRELITIRHLMTHTSGLRPDIDTNPEWSGYDTAIKMACAEKPTAPPGTLFRYSDINFFLLGEVVRRVAGEGLDKFVKREIYQPLKMSDTIYLPEPEKMPRIAPTQQTDSEMLRGKVHDPTARFMGGVAGHAGLFTTAADIARYARMFLNGGTLDGVTVFKPETVRLMTTVQSPPEAGDRRGLGWDIDSGYSRPRGKYFPLGSYGHTGFTGTSLWIDPFSETFWIFLSNRVHPDGKGNVLPLQAKLADYAAEAVVGFNFVHVPGALAPRVEEPAPKTVRAPKPRMDVLNGVDVLVTNKFEPLKGLRIGLVTNHTGQDRDRNPTIDLLSSAEGVQLKALFSPEHGIRGVFDEKVNDSIDNKTGLPVYSLYGVRHKPSSEQLTGLDALVFDIQDIGCRFYTYTATLGNILEACGDAHLKCFVLDRVNPINGAVIDGPILKGESSFIGYHSVPVRYGMTSGELARMYNSERNINADLTVIGLQNWKRELWFDETALPWTNPSPNMRSLNEAVLYPGIGLLETTALSVGRGTDTPFEVIGAPYINDRDFAKALNSAALPAVSFVPIRFTPRASVYKGTNCAGVNIIVTDRNLCPVIDVGIVIAQTLHRLYPNDFQIEKFNNLLRDPETIQAIKAGKTLAEIKASWSHDLDQFKTRRRKFLLY